MERGQRKQGWPPGLWLQPQVVVGFRAGFRIDVVVGMGAEADVEAVLSWEQGTAGHGVASCALVKVLAIDSLGTFLHTLYCPDPDTSPGPSGGRACAVTPSL